MGRKNTVRTHVKKGELYADFQYKKSRFKIKASVPIETVKEIDIDARNWETVYSKHPYRLRYNKDTCDYILIINDKHVIRASEKTHRTVLRHLYRSWAKHANRLNTATHQGQ